MEDADGRLDMAGDTLPGGPLQPIGRPDRCGVAAAQAKEAERLAETSGAGKPAGLPVPPTPRPPSPTMKAVGRDGEAARRTPGAIMPSTIVWKL